MELASLTKTQKNQIAEILTKLGFNITRFSFEQVPSKVFSKQPPVDKLVMKDSPYFFQFDLDKDGDHYAFHSPGFDKAHDRYFSASWNAQWQRFLDWARVLKVEVNVVDPWGKVEAYLPTEELDINVRSEEDRKFSSEEVRRIESALDTIAGRLNEQLKLGEEQNKRLQETVNYLKEQVKKQDRISWKHLLIGAIAEWAIAAAIPKEMIPILWNIVKETFQTMVWLISPIA